MNKLSRLANHNALRDTYVTSEQVQKKVATSGTGEWGVGGVRIEGNKIWGGN